MKKILLMLCMSVLLIFSGCSKQEEPLVDKTLFMMDTVIQLKAYGDKANEAIDAAAKRLEEIEQMASTTIDTSDISKINQTAGRDHVNVHPEIMKMIKTAVKYSELSNGAFDITVGPLVKIWGIGKDSEKVPTDDEIKSRLPLVGYSNIEINEAGNSIKLLKTGMSIDLGGIAKGFAADEVIKIFKKHEIKSALISLGGSTIYSIGEKPDGAAWRVGIQHPRRERNQGLAGIVHLANQALSTSGDYERFFIKDGERYHHILDPKTGYPTNSGVMSSTIIINENIPDSNMLADIFTKVVFVSGVEKGLETVEGFPGVSGLVITTDNKIYKSSDWKAQIIDVSPELTMEN